MEYQYEGPGVALSELISYNGVPTKLYTLDSFFYFQGLEQEHRADTSRDYFKFILDLFNKQYDFAKDNPVALVGFVYGYTNAKSGYDVHGVDLFKIRPTKEWSQNNMIDSWTFERESTFAGFEIKDIASKHLGIGCVAELKVFNEELTLKMTSRDRNEYIKHTVAIPPYLKSKVKAKA
ncbi:MAG: hypothetical protein KGH61_03090 [Candidatus Micrarchaeota archaeon]|nr:hypothetical protein [Candidatus Micrarchaeota archaeon]MDE1847908.1 hypothetical protein [Candidatus Micrarchaeota archaeon]MDE1864534.1 hypothetical protein [Candidatus Micrarchaeota archaeon]